MHCRHIRVSCFPTTCFASAMVTHSSSCDHGAGYEFQLLHVMHRQHMELAGYPDVPSNGKQLEVMVQQLHLKLSSAAQRRTDAPGAILAHYVPCERHQPPSHCATQQCSRLNDVCCAPACHMTLYRCLPLMHCSWRPFQLTVFQVSPALHLPRQPLQSLSPWHAVLPRRLFHRSDGSPAFAD